MPSEGLEIHEKAWRDVVQNTRRISNMRRQDITIAKAANIQIRSLQSILHGV